MFGIPINVLLIAAAAAIGAMLFAVAVFLPQLSSEKRSGERLKGITNSDALRAQRSKQDEATRRRKNVQETLKEIEEKDTKKNTKVTLSGRIKQAGLSISKPVFFMICAVSGLIFAVIGFVVQPANPLIALGLLVSGSIGFPFWILNFLKKRRISKFIGELPDAVDIIVRGIKAGLPLNDGMRMVAAEAKEPLASEFRNVVETQQLGVPMAEAVMKLYENIPTPETNFFATVIAIQQNSGGSLSEALGNLSKILRERKKMRAKVKAISSEAKASAAIIGSLPVFVAVVVFLMSPDYISLLFTTSAGNIVLMVAAGLMFTGVMVMRKMINFEI